MNEVIEMVYDDHSRTYISAEEFRELSRYNNASQKSDGDVFNPQYYDSRPSDILKNIIRLSPILISIACGSLLPLALYVAPLLSVALNPHKDVMTTDGECLPNPKTGRRRKGRTNLPLYDIQNDCMSTRANNI